MTDTILSLERMIVRGVNKAAEKIDGTSHQFPEQITLVLQGYGVVLRPYEELFEKPEEVAASYHNRGLARTFLDGDEKKLSGALLDLEKAIKIEPDNVLHYIARAVARIRLGHHIDLVFNDLNRAITLDHKNPTDYHCKGLVLQRLSLHDAAVQSFSRAIILDPTNVMSYYRRGISHSELGNTVDAGTDFNHASGMIGQERDTVYGLSKFRIIGHFALISGLSMEHCEGLFVAIQYYEKMLQAERADLPQLHFQMGSCLEKIGNLGEAVWEYQTYLREAKADPFCEDFMSGALRMSRAADFLREIGRDVSATLKEVECQGLI